MKKFERTTKEKILDFFFRLKLKFLFHFCKGQKVRFLRIYPKLNRIEPGWLISKVPNRDAYLVINKDETYWTKRENIYYLKNSEKKNVVYKETKQITQMFVLTDKEIIVNKLTDEGNETKPILIDDTGEF